MPDLAVAARRPRAHRAGLGRRAARAAARAAPLDAAARLRQRAALPRGVRRGRGAPGRLQATWPTWPSYPLTSKADLRENYPFGMFAVPREQVVRVHASLGHHGPDHRGRLHQRRHRGVGHGDGPLDPGGGRPSRPRPAQRLRLRAVHRRASARTTGRRSSAAPSFPVSGGMTERQVTLIRDFRPDIIMVTPSYMLAILDEMERQGDDPAASSLRFGIFGAEPWTNEMRAEMEARAAARRHRHLRPVRGDRAGGGAGVRGDQGRPAHLGGPLLPRGDRPGHRASRCPTARRASSSSPR